MLNIFTMMIDASIPNLPVDEYKEILGKMNDRFLLDMDNK